MIKKSRLSFTLISILLLFIGFHLYLLQQLLKEYTLEHHVNTNAALLRRLMLIVEISDNVKKMSFREKQMLFSVYNTAYTTFDFLDKPLYPLKLKYKDNVLLMTSPEDKLSDSNFKPTTQKALAQFFDQQSIFNKKIMLSIYNQAGQWINFKYYRPLSQFPIKFSIVSLCFSLVLTILITAWLIVSLKFSIPLKELKQNIENLSGNHLKDLPERGPETLKEAIHSINNLKTKIQSLNNERDIIFATLAQDIDTPLEKIKLHLSQSDQYSCSDKEKLLFNVNLIYHMLNEMMWFAKYHHQPFQICRIEFIALMRSVISEIEELNLPVDFHTTLKKIDLSGDPILLNRAFHNLIYNAIKYGKKAIVSVEKNHHALLIRIDDKGEGLSIEEQAQVFTPFYRSDKHKHLDGHGLGLSMAKMVIEKHHGSIMFSKPQKNQGLSIRIALESLLSPREQTA